jgi:Putative zinc-finger
MSTSPPDPGCETTHDDLAELALGMLSGLERSVVLSHVQGCSKCRDEVDRLSAVADAILTLAPEVEPQAGFETRLFERMGVVRPRRWQRPTRRVQRIALAGSALFGGLGIGLGLAFSSGGGSAVATPPAIVANLTADHAPRGEVYVAPGDPSWLFMSVAHAKVTGLVTCRITTAGGRTTTIGTFWLASGSGTWAYQLDVPANQVKRAWVVTDDGTVLASATLSR